MLKSIFLLSVLFFTACASSPKLPPQPTVPHVDISRFMQRWYVIASIPTSFESDAYNATETYSWNEKEKRVDIDFRYHKGSASGPEKKIPQKGFIYNETTNSEWRVQPFWPLKFAYLIVDLAPDYSTTIIGVPDRDHVWIMAKTPTIPDAIYAKLKEKVKTLGYDLAKLKLVPQSW